MTLAPSGLLKQTGKKDWVDFAKGVAILLVVLYHSMLFLRSMDLPVFGVGRVKVGLEMFPMPVFLFIAGLYHFRVVDWTFQQTWKRRLLGYLYLYALWSVIRFAFYFVVPNVRADGAGSLATNPLALLTVLVWPINSYWFILALFVFTLLLQAVKSLPRWVPLTVSTLLSLAFGTGLVTVFNVGWDRMAEYLLFFLVGAFFSRRLFDAVAGARTRFVLTAGAVYLVAALVAAFVPIGARIPGVVLIGEAAAIAFGATAAVRLARVRPLGWISYLGARSLQIYLLHIFVIAALSAIAVHVPLLAHLPGHGAVLAGTMVVLVVLISLALSRLIDRWSWFYVPPRWLQKSLASGVPASKKPQTATQP